MSKNFFAALLILLFVIPEQGEAQILRALERKVEERVEKRMDRKRAEQEAKIDQRIDAGIDEILNAPETAIEEGKNNRRAQTTPADMNAMIQASNNIELRPNYQFHTKVTYEQKEGRSRAETINYLLSDNHQLFAMESGRDLMIYDIEKDAVIIVSDRDKTMQPMSMEWIRNFGSQFNLMLPDDEDDTTSNFTIRNVPGATKTIAGLLCEKYEFSDNDSFGELWFTNAADARLVDLTQNLMKMFASNFALPAGETLPFENLFLMQAVTTDKQTNTTSELTVTHIGTETKNIQSSQYKRGSF